MPTRPVIFALSALLVAGLGLPAVAGQRWHRGEGRWHGADRAHHVLYRLENEIAFLEADPEIDDGYKAPVIAGARADVRRLRAVLGAAHWRWTVPCCYSRPAISIR